VYTYQINGENMRDEYFVRGIYLELRSTFRIKEIDILQIVNYVGFLIAAAIIIHFILECILLWNPFMKGIDAAHLDARKYFRDEAQAGVPIAMHDDMDGSLHIEDDGDELDFGRLINNN
jgi:hypothetical protein